MSTIPLEPQQGILPDIQHSLVPLGSAIWIDLEGGLLIREGEEIQLTAREVHVLEILVQSMRSSRGYLMASAIAQRLNLSFIFDPEHSIEQTISVLRRKLGEVPHHPQILRGRRGLGYRLFPDRTQLEHSLH